MKPIRFTLFVTLLGLLAGSGGNLLGQGNAFTYQGRFNTNGSPYTGIAEFQFTLWDAASGGQVAVATTLSIIVGVTNGLFATSLDFGAAAFPGADRWLQIEVRPGGDNSSYTVLAPRSKVHSTPYAFFAHKVPWSGISVMPVGFADGVDDNTTYSAGAGLNLSGTTLSVAPGGVDSSMLANQAVTLAKLDLFGAGEGQALTFHNSNVSWNNPTASKLLLPFSASAANENNALISIHNTALAGNARAYYGETASEFGSAIYGLASNGGIGLEGVAHAGGAGVFGFSSAATGEGTGVHGESASMSGYGVKAYATSTSGAGVGVFGQSDSANGIAMEAVATAASGTNFGLSAKAMGNKGIGVFAKAGSPSGPTFGVWGESSSPEGTGVYGLARASTGYAIGINGSTESPDGIGVAGEARALAGGVGVAGTAASPNGIGVSGTVGGDAISYGVGGTSFSTHGKAAGVIASGYGAASPGVPQASALTIDNGAIRVSGAHRPAGTIQAPPMQPMSPLISCPTECPTCNHGHTIGWYQDVLLQNDLIVGDSIILATVQTIDPPMRVSYYVQVFNQQPGSIRLRITAMGSIDSDCTPPSDNIKVHYQIINPFPEGE